MSIQRRKLPTRRCSTRMNHQSDKSDINAQLNQTKTCNSDKPHQCRYCDNYYKTKYTLNLHVKEIHEYHKNELHKCSLCSYSSIRKGRVSHHERTVHRDERPFQCTTCDKCFKTKGNLDVHVKAIHEYHKNELFNCSMCSYSSIRKSRVSHHEKIVHQEERPFQCTTCDKCFKTEEASRQHQKIHSDDRPYVCPYCSYAGKRQHDITKHIKIKHESHKHEPYSCSLCPYTSFYRSCVSDHEKTHKIDRPFECPHCEYKCKMKGNLTLHIQRVHSTGRPFKCAVEGCNQTFTTAEYLKHHGLVHTDVKPFQCNTCGKHFKTKATLKNHNMKIHSEDRPFVCPHCDYAAKERGNLKQHMIRHTGYRPFHCKEEGCGFSFHTGHELISHGLVHREDRPFSCDKCQSVFKCLSSLKSHKYRVHSDTRPFACEVEGCGKNFKTAADLRLHSLVHSDMKPHRCDICSKDFKSPRYLKLHKTFHSNERPFKCSLCEYTGKRMEDVRHHKRRSHSSRSNLPTFKCSKEGCSKTFKTRSSLKAHERNVHSQEYPFVCTLCDYKSKVKGSITAHMLTHTSHRPFECKEEGCDKRFKTAIDLRKHGSVHIESKHVPCDHCDKTFKSDRAVVLHLRRLDRRGSFDCEICHKNFAYKDIMQQHMQIVHSDVRPFECGKCGMRFKLQALLNKHLKCKSHSKMKSE